MSSFFNNVYAASMKITETFRSRLDKKEDKTLLHEAAEVSNSIKPWNSPRLVWKFAWNIHKFFLNHILHRFDDIAPADTFVNLSVLWWKAIANLDDGLSFDLLPAYTRSIVRFPLNLLYPQLHSANVAIRTNYINKLIENEIENNTCDKIKIITLGGGFDIRSVRMALKFTDKNIDYFELDLPNVKLQKYRMLHERLLSRRPNLITDDLPILVSQDLNDLERLELNLKDILNDQNNKNVKVIFIIEAVLMYIDQTKVEPLLKLIGSSFKENIINGDCSIAFADRFQPVVDAVPYNRPINSDKIPRHVSEQIACENWFNSIGYDLKHFQAKPGRARTMGLVKLR